MKKNIYSLLFKVLVFCSFLLIFYFLKVTDFYINPYSGAERKVKSIFNIKISINEEKILYYSKIKSSSYHDELNIWVLYDRKGFLAPNSAVYEGGGLYQTLVALSDYMENVELYEAYEAKELFVTKYAISGDHMESEKAVFNLLFGVDEVSPPVTR